MDESQSLDEEIRLRRRVFRPAPSTVGLAGVCSLASCVVLLFYAMTPSSFASPDDPLRPPFSTTGSNVEPAVAIYVTRDSLLVDHKPLGLLIDPESHARLREALERRHADHPMCDLTADGGRSRWMATRDDVLLIADEDTPYGEISSVISDAYAAGFVNVKLVTRNMQ